MRRGARSSGIPSLDQRKAGQPADRLAVEIALPIGASELMEFERLAFLLDPSICCDQFSKIDRSIMPATASRNAPNMRCATEIARLTIEWLISTGL